MWSVQFGLVCEKLPLLPLLTSTYMIGIILATLIVGSLSGRILKEWHFYHMMMASYWWHLDHFGRRKLILCGSLVHLLASWAAWLAPVSWWWWWWCMWWWRWWWRGGWGWNEHLHWYWFLGLLELPHLTCGSWQQHSRCLLSFLCLGPGHNIGLSYVAQASKVLKSPDVSLHD